MVEEKVIEEEKVLEEEEEKEKVMEEKEKLFCRIFLPLAWSGHIGLGLALGIFGPTQPYLARNVEVSVDTINFIWTGRSIGFMITSVLTAVVFKKYCRQTWQKMAFLATAELITGAFVFLTPWASSFPVLLVFVTIFGMSLGLFDTADNSLMVYIFGPVKSRPFTQSVHAFVGVGFVLGSILVQPFLPESNSGDASVCPGTDAGNGTDSRTGALEALPKMAGLPSIYWPFIAIGVWHFITAAGLLLLLVASYKSSREVGREDEKSCGGKLLLGCSGLKMPSFYGDTAADKESGDEGGVKELLGWGPLLLLVYIYYVMSCGLEGFFQSNTYTYALCGPLKMPPADANLLNILYYAAFVSGRLSGIFISRLVNPTKIIISSISGCIVGSLLLTVLAPYHSVALYVGVIIMGFAISFQFASGISWTANLFNVTGTASFIFFFGAFTGFLSFPPIAGAIIASAIGGFFYLALATILAQAALFALMCFMARGREVATAN